LTPWGTIVSRLFAQLELTAIGNRRCGPPKDLTTTISGRPELNRTGGLTEQDAVLVYDSALLDRVAGNEHSFKGPPGDALLLVFTIRLDPNEEADLRGKVAPSGTSQ
jgi:hypothetical protein